MTGPCSATWITKLSATTVVRKNMAIWRAARFLIIQLHEKHRLRDGAPESDMPPLIIGQAETRGPESEFIILCHAISPFDAPNIRAEEIRVNNYFRGGKDFAAVRPRGLHGVCNRQP